MQWSDERYVKLYSRDTAAWLMWPWQARALLPLLLRKADGSGLLDLGRRDQLTALSVLVGLPSDVVEPGIAALLADGTVEAVERGYLLPRFIEAQEATKTERAKKRDQRERTRAQVREITTPPVPQCPSVSPGVPQCPPPAQPSLAQPISAQPRTTAPAASQPPLALVGEVEARHTKPPPLSDQLCATFARVRGAPYVWQGAKDGAALARLLKAASEAEVLSRWERGLMATGWLQVATVAQLASKWNDLAPDARTLTGSGPMRSEVSDEW